MKHTKLQNKTAQNHNGNGEEEERKKGQIEGCAHTKEYSTCNYR